MRTIKDLFHRYRFEIVAFITSAVLLSVEITGGRLLAPYFGLSSYVWTAMIGTILSFLSLGYWLGGRVADRDEPQRDIGVIIAFGGLVLLLSNTLTEPVLSAIDSLSVDLRISAVLAASLLFGPASLLIGFITPHLAKIRVTSLKTSGESIGRLEAASALGSIFGTFVSGYILLGYFGSRDIGLMLAIVLLGSSFIAEHKRLFWARIASIAFGLLILTTPVANARSVIDDIDTAHARYKVVAGIKEGRAVNYLVTDGQSIQSGVSPDAPGEIVLDYGKQFDNVLSTLTDPIESMAIIGGAVHSLPRQLAEKYSIDRVVSVEIDPELDKIARKYFAFSGEQVETVYEDGRTFLTNSQDRFGIIIADAFSATSPPFHLTTVEAAQSAKSRLTDSGLLISNVISKYPEGYLQNVVATQLEVFEDVIVLTDGDELINGSKQNFIVIAGNKSELLGLREKFQAELVTVTPTKVLTDDFAPVERLTY